VVHWWKAVFSMCQRARATARPFGARRSLAGDEHAPGARVLFGAIEPGDPAAHAADLALVAHQGLEVAAVPKGDPLAGLRVLDDLVGSLICPLVQCLAQRLVRLLAGDDDGTHPERLGGGEEGAVGIKRVRHHHVDPAEALVDSLEESGGCGLLPFVETSLDEPRRGALALHGCRAQVLGQQGLDVHHEVESPVDQERHRVAV
jgi:hypothetical protein